MYPRLPDWMTPGLRSSKPSVSSLSGQQNQWRTFPSIEGSSHKKEGTVAAAWVLPPVNKKGGNPLGDEAKFFAAILTQPEPSGQIFQVTNFQILPKESFFLAWAQISQLLFKFSSPIMPSVSAALTWLCFQNLIFHPLWCTQTPLRSCSFSFWIVSWAPFLPPPLPHPSSFFSPTLSPIVGTHFPWSPMLEDPFRLPKPHFRKQMCSKSFSGFLLLVE